MADSPIIPGGSNLTQSQYLIWLGQQLTPYAPLYNMAFAFDVSKALDSVKFASAFDQLVLSHDSLRTVIDPGESVPTQRVLDKVPAPLVFVDMTDASEQEIGDYLSASCQEMLNLAECTYRSKLISAGENRTIWFLCHHHIVSDVWSFKLLYERLQQFYKNENSGVEWPQFAEHRKHEESLEESYGKSAKADLHDAYWNQKLSTPCPPLKLYRDVKNALPHSVRETQLFGLANSSRLIGLAESLTGSLSRDLGAVSYLAAMFVSLLFRLTGNKTICLGMPFHNRTTPTRKQTSGLLLEVLALRIQVNKEDNLETLAERVKNEITQSLLHNRPSNRSLDVSKSFQIVLNYMPLSFPDFCGSPTSARWLHCNAGDANHQLRLQVHGFNDPGSYQFDFDFNTQACNGRERRSLMASYEHWFEQCLVKPDAKIVSLDLLSTNEHENIVKKFNSFLDADNAQRSPSPGATVLTSFEQQTLIAKNKTAVACKDQTLTFGALDELGNNVAANLLAGSLIDNPDEKQNANRFVVACLPRSIEAVVAIIGILKSGAAFVPVDPSLPRKRMDAVVKDLLEYPASSVSVITQTGSTHQFDQFGDRCRVFCIEELKQNPGRHLQHATSSDPKSLAYVMYTSGSTGVPKGVMISHAALSNYVSWAASHYVRGDELSFALHSSLSFDLTITSLFLPLVTGNRMLVYPQPEDGSDLAVLDVFEHNEADFIKLTPSHLAVVPNDLLKRSNIKRMIVGGEAFSTKLARQINQTLSDSLEIYNEYGPTEATVGCMHHQFDPQHDTGSDVPIGKPVADQQIYVLDEFLKPLPPGFKGEIYIGGSGLANGYLNKQSETNRRFVSSPFAPSQKFYKSGDSGYFGHDHILHYTGRIDNQIKVRGVRVEPGEIEAAIYSHPDIKECAVVDVVIDHGKTAASVHGLVHCKACGISSSYPDIVFNDDDVCNICVDYEIAKPRLSGYFGNDEELAKIAVGVTQQSTGQSTGNNDCVALVSGGKDSTYMLYRLVELGLKPVVFTLDNGYLSEQAKSNIENVASDLELELVYGGTEHMNEIFSDSLARFSNVCQGCFKTIYTLSMQFALDREINTIFTGLSRGQLFETRLQDLYNRPEIHVKDFDTLINDARKAYHRMDDVVSRCLNTPAFEDGSIFDNIKFVDFYRYVDVSLDHVMRYLGNTAWRRPLDTGRSTNCRINDVGIYVHKRRQGFHNYELPYSWDVRIGHKTREQALHELNDDIDEARVQHIFEELRMQDVTDVAHESQELMLAAYYAADKTITREELTHHMLESLPSNLIPAHIVSINSLPKNTNGKIDRAALKQQFSKSESLEKASRAPRTDVEKKLLNIWQAAFGHKDFGVESNFFDLGGDSMTAIQIIHRAAAEQLILTTELLFRLPAIADHANLVEGARAETEHLPDVDDIEIDIALSLDDYQQLIESTQKPQL